jgi:hypothetical protein
MKHPIIQIAIIVIVLYLGYQFAALELGYFDVSGGVPDDYEGEDDSAAADGATYSYDAGGDS